MSEVYDFLKAAGTFFVTTVDGDKPRVRPFGFCMEYNGKVYFGGGNHKEFYRQLLANPEVEICACKGPEWIRIRGRVKFHDDSAALDAAWENSPNLKGMYTQPDGPRMALFTVEEPSVVWATLAGGATRTMSM